MNCKGIRTINRRGRRRQSLCRAIISRLRKKSPACQKSRQQQPNHRLSGNTYNIYRSRSELPKRPRLSHSRIRHDVSMLVDCLSTNKFVAVMFTKIARYVARGCIAWDRKRILLRSQGEDRDLLYVQVERGPRVPTMILCTLGTPYVIFHQEIIKGLEKQTLSWIKRSLG